MNPLLTVLLLLNCSRGQCYVLQEYHEGSICCKQPAGVEITSVTPDGHLDVCYILGPHGICSGFSDMV